MADERYDVISVYLHKGMPIGATAHQAPTVRFGTASALDVNCRAHDVDNLYVVDNELLPQHRCRQPVAHGHRQCAARRRPGRPARLTRNTRGTS